MTDLKEVEQLKTDLELVTKTAKVLATKLEKMSQSVERLFASLGGQPIPKDVQPSSPPVSAQPAPQPTVSAAPVAEPTSSAVSGTSKAGRLLDSFLNQVHTMTKGKEIADALSRLRDQVMQSAGIGFHPAFHEMGRYASNIKNIGEITAGQKEELVEKVYDWKQRLLS
ncbi:MAG: hypothetical protein ACFFAE_21445 [Candidatus Hodarchaeota archaeon]